MGSAILERVVGSEEDEVFWHFGNRAVFLDSGGGNDEVTALSTSGGEYRGGAGDDRYESSFIGDPSTWQFAVDIREEPGGGEDTVVVTGSFSPGSFSLAVETDGALHLYSSGVIRVYGPVEFFDIPEAGGRVVLSREELLARNTTHTGTDAGDVLQTSQNTDLVRAGLGDDTIAGSMGADTIIGGPGYDVLDFSDAGLTSGIRGQYSAFNSMSQDAFAFDVMGDLQRYWDIEEIRGTAFNDVFSDAFSENAARTQYGLGGNDTFFTSLAVERFFGGSGTDTVVIYAFAGDGTYSASLTTGLGTGSSGVAGDQFDSIENLRVEQRDLFGERRFDLTGNAENNVLSGASANDTLSGMDGHDILRGLDGNDRLTGGLGDDSLEGGSGIDTAVIEVTYGNGSGIAVDRWISQVPGLFVTSDMGADLITSDIEFIEFLDTTVTYDDLSALVPSELILGTEGGGCSDGDGSR